MASEAARVGRLTIVAIFRSDGHIFEIYRRFGGNTTDGEFMLLCKQLLTLGLMTDACVLPPALLLLSSSSVPRQAAAPPASAPSKPAWARRNTTPRPGW